MDPSHLEKYVIIPACELLGLSSPAAHALLLGTAAQESCLGRYVRQVGGGPALGIFQMEPATFHDILDNFLKFRPELMKRFKAKWPLRPEPERMVTDLLLAAVMARLLYFRVDESLPDAHDIAALARYWKRHYNTPLGKGTPLEFSKNWHNLVEKGKAA